MNRIKIYLNGLGRGAHVLILSLAVIFVGAGIAQATSTTIDTSVATTNLTASGTLGVTGQTTLGHATSTLLSVHSAYFGGIGSGATSTFATSGALDLGGALTGTSGSFTTTLGVTGLSSLGKATSTMLSAHSAYFGGVGSGATTTVSSGGNLAVGGTLKVGTSGTQTTQVIAGYCVATAAFTLASTTGVYADCVPYTTANAAITTLTAVTDRVFVMATSSLPAWVVIQSASTTAGAKINVQMVNVSTTTTAASATYAFNFWAFQ